MYGVVPAAGRGTRLRPLTDDRPKGLVEVGGEPLLTRCFETLRALGVDEVVVVVGYRADDIVATYGDSVEGLPLSYAHQNEPLGLAHALLAAEASIDGPFVLFNGDNVCAANLSAVVATHERTGADVTLLVDEVSPEAASRTGVVSFDEKGQPNSLIEKPDNPPSTTVPRGFYAFSPRIFEACRAIEPSPTGEYELTAAVDWLLAHGGEVETVSLDGWCVNVNTQADLDRVERLLDA